MDFRDCVKMREPKHIIEEAVDPFLEVTRRINSLEPDPVLFQNVNGMPLATNFFSSRAFYAEYLNIPLDGFIGHLSDKMANHPMSLTTSDAIFGDEEWDEIDLLRLPILTHYRGDGGPFITSGVWIVNDPQFGRNLSYHRMMITCARGGPVRVVENRGLHQALQRSGGGAEIAICIGASPAVLLAAACSPPDDVDEMELAARLDSVSLVRCKTVNLHVPENTEIVLEGHFTGAFEPEGPFVDITGTWDKIRQQPVVEITRIAHRRDPIYHALVPGRAEHRMLMGMPKEIDIYNKVSKECQCLDVRVTEGGAAWLHAVVQIRKQRAADGRSALEAAFRAHRSLKHCVVVDEDIDISDMTAVEWAIATRFQADVDLLVLTDQPSSSLDPSAMHIEGVKSRGSKMGLDATIKHFDEKRKLFKRINA